MKATTLTASSPTHNAAYVAVAGRVLIAATFLWSCFGKILDPASALGYISSAGLPFPKIGLGTAILVELLGGLALVVGYRTRLVAVGLALFSLATALFFHSAVADQNQFIHFMKNVAMAGGLLQVAAFGAGPVGVDARR